MNIGIPTHRLMYRTCKHRIIKWITNMAKRHYFVAYARDLGVCVDLNIVNLLLLTIRL